MYITDPVFQAVELIFPLLLPSFHLEQLGRISNSPKMYPCVSFCRIGGSQSGYDNSKGYQRETVRFALSIEVKEGAWCDISELQDYKDHLALQQYFRSLMDQFMVMITQGPVFTSLNHIDYEDSIFSKYKFVHERTSNDYGFSKSPPNLTTGVTREYYLSFKNSVDRCCLEPTTIEGWNQLLNQYIVGSTSYRVIDEYIKSIQ